MNEDQKVTSRNTRWDLPLVWLKGFAMGTADVIPGVSGGTIALITGIYERLLAALASISPQAVRLLFRREWKAFANHTSLLFLIFLVAGIASAVLFFTKIVKLPDLMFTHPELVYGLFFGLVAGSIWVLSAQLRPLDGVFWSGLSVGGLLGFAVVSMVPIDTPSDTSWMFLYGAVAIIAMILPGISGSFILLILRQYEYVFGLIGQLGGDQTRTALMILAVFGAGAVAGLAVFSRALRWLLQRAHRPTMSLLTGFLVGSLWVIWPFQDRSYVDVVRPIEATHSFINHLELNPESDAMAEFHRLVRGDGFVRVERVKKKLVGSRPRWPDARSGVFPWIFMLGGIGLVLVIDRLGRRL